MMYCDDEHQDNGRFFFSNLRYEYDSIVCLGIICHVQTSMTFNDMYLMAISLWNCGLMLLTGYF